MRMRLWTLVAIAGLAYAGPASAAIIMVDDFMAPKGTTASPVVNTTPDNPVYPATASTSQILSRYLGQSGLNGTYGSAVMGGTREMSAQNNVASYTVANIGGTVPVNTDNASTIRYYSTVNPTATTGKDTGTYTFGNASTRYYPGTNTASTAVPSGYAGRGQGGLQYDGTVATSGTTRQMVKGGSTAAPFQRALKGTGTLDLRNYKYLVFENLTVDSTRTQTTTSTPGGATNGKAFQMTVSMNSRTTGTAQYRWVTDLLSSDDGRFFYMPLGPNNAVTPQTLDTRWTRTVTGGTVAAPASLQFISGIQIWFDNTNTAYGVNSKVSFTSVFFSDRMIPEPSTVALGVVGAIGFVVAARRRKSK